MRTILFPVMLSILTSPALADWPHWRGPERNGLVAEPSGWNGNRWRISDAAWTANVGEGSSSPLVVAGRLYSIAYRDGREHVVCFDAKTGRQQWTQSYPAPRFGRNAEGDQGIYSGTSSTPEYDAETGLLFTLGIDGQLAAWDTRKAGAPAWRVNLYDEYKAPMRPRVGRSGRRDYGYTTAPLVHGDWLIVEVGAGEGNLMAFDKRTGRRLWTSENRDPPGHAGGLVPLTVDGIPCVAVLTHFHLLVARLDREHEGQTLAEHPWVTSFANGIATPAARGNEVLITSGYNHQTICKLRITTSGAEKVWEKPYHSKVCSPVIADGHVYWSWQRVHCLDWETGERLWEGGRFGDPGSCIYTADKRLIVWGENGKLALVEGATRSPTAYRELAVRDGVFSTDAWPHVVLDEGRLYCKDRRGNLTCFLLGEKAT